MTSARTTGSLRSEQAKVAMDRIIRATLEEIDDGIEPTMRRVAARAGIADRTIYRHFPNLETLRTALVPHLQQRIDRPLCASVADLPAYVADLFNSFETNEQLTRVLSDMPWAAPILKRNRCRNRDTLLDLLTADFPCLDRKTLEAAAASLQVNLSAAGWMCLRDCGYPQAQSIRHTQWLVNTAIEKLAALHRTIVANNGAGAGED